MNFRLIARFLGVVSIFIGICMLFSLPWATAALGGDWKNEAAGVRGILVSSAVCCLLGRILLKFGQKTDAQLLRKESLAVVGLSWILAAFLGALPYLVSGTETSPGVRMSFADAIFESQSGFSTTGASVVSDVENPQVISRTILFWRCTTHFLGGLGIMVFFVVILGQGSMGKAVMRIEKGAGSESNPTSKMRQMAIYLLRVYLGMIGVMILILVALGVSWFDAICHSFSTIATGGFSSLNSSVGHFAANTNLNAGLIEGVFIFFMFCAGTNFSLLYFCLIGQPQKMFRDVEWRTYVGIIAVAVVLIFVSGTIAGDFDVYGTSDAPIVPIPTTELSSNEIPDVLPPNPEPSSISADSLPVSDQKAQASPVASVPSPIARPSDVPQAEPRLPWPIALRNVIFSVVSIITSSGFCVDEHNDWNALSLFVITVLMFVGGCAGSTAGGVKVIRSVIMFKTFDQEIEKSFRPNVVRTLKLNGQTIDRSVQNGVIIFLLFFGVAIALFTTAVLIVEPDTQWTSQGLGYSDKLTDVSAATLSAFSNIGVSLGVAGARSNFSGFSDASKLIFSAAMLLGRLELYVVLVLLSPTFWKNR